MKDWTAILPLLGVAVGWLLNQATARRTERLADQRIIKEMLYSLLELHRLLRALGWTNANLPELVTAFRKQLPVAPPAEYEAAVDELLTNLVRDALTSFFGQQLASLKDDYTAALVKLAAVDPISAYRLRGQEDALRDIQQLVTTAREATVARLGEPPADQPDYLAFLRQQLEPEEIASTRDLVLDVMKQLAAQLNRRTRRGLSTLLAKTEPNGQELMKELQGRVAKALAAMPQQEG
ncbi:MAG: hypothetical protein JWP58_1786 [Hymenobacter sp.]|nr:hypothetical protein [Hymenobacter sp.]